MRKQREKALLAQRSGMVRVLFYLNTALWLFLSLNTLAEMIVDGNELSALLVGFFLLVNVLALFFSGWLLDTSQKWTYVFAFIVAVLNIIVSFIGVPDFLFVTSLIIDFITLGVLISIRRIIV
ncbi:MAG: hypothetical protein JNM02_04885 [Anaerolineales bacterium]|nr:hypothetical protein [Anaerolineales bacterium]